MCVCATLVPLKQTLPTSPTPNTHQKTKNTEAQRIAAGGGKEAALAGALAKQTDVLKCIYSSCSGAFNIGDACSNSAAASAGQAGCVLNVCTWRAFTKSPLIWESALFTGQRCLC